MTGQQSPFLVRRPGALEVGGKCMPKRVMREQTDFPFVGLRHFDGIDSRFAYEIHKVVGKVADGSLYEGRSHKCGIRTHRPDNEEVFVKNRVKWSFYDFGLLLPTPPGLLRNPGDNPVLEIDCLPLLAARIVQSHSAVVTEKCYCLPIDRLRNPKDEVNLRHLKRLTLIGRLLQKMIVRDGVDHDQRLRFGLAEHLPQNMQSFIDGLSAQFPCREKIDEIV